MKFDYYLCKKHSLEKMYVKDKKNNIYRLKINGGDLSFKKSKKQINEDQFYKSTNYSKKIVQKMIQKGGDTFIPPINFEENISREAIIERNIGNNRNDILQNELRKLSNTSSKRMTDEFEQIYRNLALNLKGKSIPEHKISLPLYLNNHYIDIDDDIYTGNSPLIHGRRENAKIIKEYYQMVILFIYNYFYDVYQFLYNALQEIDLKKQNQEKQQKQQRSLFSWRRKPKPLENIYNENYMIEMQVLDRGRNVESLNSILSPKDPRRRIVFQFNNTEISLNFILEYLKKSPFEKKTLEKLIEFKNFIDSKFYQIRYERQKYGNE